MPLSEMKNGSSNHGEPFLLKASPNLSKGEEQEKKKERK
jgi:hypothetical protein